MKNDLEGSWVFDSNLFVYAIDETSEFYQQAREVFGRIALGHITGIVTQQNIVEAEYVVVKLYKKDLHDVVALFANILSGFNFRLLIPTASTLENFHALIKTSRGKADVFDYYLAATMIENSEHKLLTLNAKDFASIPHIQAVNPFTSG